MVFRLIWQGLQSALGGESGLSDAELKEKVIQDAEQTDRLIQIETARARIQLRLIAILTLHVCLPLAVIIAAAFAAREALAVSGAPGTIVALVTALASATTVSVAYGRHRVNVRRRSMQAHPSQRDAILGGGTITGLAFTGAAIKRFQSATYEEELHAAQAEIEQDEIDDGVEELAEFLGASQPLEGLSDPGPYAAATARGLTEIFAALGPPPPGIAKKYGDGGPGSDDGVGAGPRGHNV